MSDVIRVGHLDLSFHGASALEVEMVLKRHGHTIERSAAPHEAMFTKLAQGEVDVLVSAWLPSSHGSHLAPLQADVLKVSILYMPYCIWGVADYVPESQVASVEDLLREPALGRMEKLIQGINPGAGIVASRKRSSSSTASMERGITSKPGPKHNALTGLKRLLPAGVGW